MRSRSLIYRMSGAVIAGSAVVAAILVAPATATAAPDAPASVNFKTSAKEVSRAVPPMGAAAAAKTASARSGKARSQPKDSQGVAVAPPARSPGLMAPGRFHELQLNLCNSGFASCYRNGDAVYEGGDLIYYLAPDLVTLNEICLDDLPEYLQLSLAEAWPNDWTYYVFYPAIDRRTNSGYLCNNGSEYGNAVLGRVPAARWRGVNAWGGEYTAQDSTNEKRTFACAYAIGDHFACATHLSSANEPLALSQCRALMSSAVPYIRSVEGVTGKTVVGGDFNLEYDTADPENVQLCVPSGYIRKGDGDVQHVMFSNDISFTSTQKYGLTYTDHDGFLVRLVMP